ncbi:MAG: SGNH/GDSL hydrolase family protein [Candidatus Alcyoniella australis]|nr:SGNH/GDSL hydrolase family protein [Candidatus Alcyoniella australis]
MSDKRLYRLAVIVLGTVAAILFIEIGAKYCLYYHNIYRSYSLMRNYYNFEGDFWDFEKRQREVLENSTNSSPPIANDIYNRRFYLPSITGHQWGMYHEPASDRPQQGQTRILCLGTSTSEGGYSKELQEILNHNYPGHFEVINAGIPGSTMLHMLMNFSLTWRNLEAQFVIIEAPVDSLLINDIPFIVSDGLFKELEDPLFFNRPKRIELFPGLNKALELVGSHRAEHQTDDAKARFRQTLEALVVSIKGSGATPLIMTYQPALSLKYPTNEFSPDFLVSANTFYHGFFYNFTIAGALEAIEGQNEIMRETAAKYGVTLIDAENVLPRKDQYFLDGTHHSDLGSSIIGQLIADRVANHEQTTRQ